MMGRGGEEENRNKGKRRKDSRGASCHRRRRINKDFVLSSAMAGRCFLFLLSVVFAVILFIHTSEAQYPRYRGPQGLVFPDDNGRPRPQPRPTRPTRPTTTTRPNECSCPSTPEYNPVCGTDAISYSNPGKLNCARRCGKDVSILHYGNCTPPDPNAPSTTPSTTTPRRRG